MGSVPVFCSRCPQSRDALLPRNRPEHTGPMYALASDHNKTKQGHSSHPFSQYLPPKSVSSSRPQKDAVLIPSPSVCSLKLTFLQAKATPGGGGAGGIRKQAGPGGTLRAASMSSSHQPPRSPFLLPTSASLILQDLALDARRFLWMDA